MTDAHGRGMASSLRGWLSEVYFPALASSQVAPLALRLGDRATIEDPIFGRCSGRPELDERLEQMARWLSERDAAYESRAFVTGSDRDVAEGALTLTIGDRRVTLPVAVVTERRREREVELRAYYAAAKLGATPLPQREPLPSNEQITVPPPVAAHLEALARGDVDGVVASFEYGGTLRSPDGVTHAKIEGGGALRSYYANLITFDGTPAGLQVQKSARADDGNTCALEYTVVRLRGRNIPPQTGLAVYERGESGLLRTVRVYDDIA